MKEKDCERENEGLSKEKKAQTESMDMELDVKEGITKITDVINSLKETALKMKGAKVKMKDWSLLVTYSEEQYLVDFKMNVSVKPEKM